MPQPDRIDLHAIARSAMGQYGFQPFFPKAVIREVEALDEAAVLGNPPDSVADLRGLLWSSIDNADSLDLDQLEFCEPAAGGEIKVKVAIADVDAYVARASRTDEHAAKNGTSVYTGIETFPMLPQRLCTELTSLLAGQARLAVIIEYTVLSDGTCRYGAVYRGLVRNQAKLVYEETGDWLEGSGAIPETVRRTAGLEAQLRLQDQAAQRLRARRLRQGALELEIIEARAVIKDETVQDMIVPKINRARQVIENFMIAANETIVGFLDKADVPMIQRVVRAPRDWQGIVAIAAASGTSLPAEPDPVALSAFLKERKAADPERFPDLSLAVVKLLGPGEYAMLAPGQTSAGHFGLAVLDYTHSTAPNRRYADMIIQRLVKCAIQRNSCPYTEKQLSDLAARCTERDKFAKKVERFMRKAEAAVLLSGRLNETFDAIVTGASAKGYYARIIAPPAEGRIMRGGDGLRVGQKIRIRLVNMDPYKGFIDFERVHS